MGLKLESSLRNNQQVPGFKAEAEGSIARNDCLVRNAFGKNWSSFLDDSSVLQLGILLGLAQINRSIVYYMEDGFRHTGTQPDGIPPALRLHTSHQSCGRLLLPINSLLVAEGAKDRTWTKTMTKTGWSTTDLVNDLLLAFQILSALVDWRATSGSSIQCSIENVFHSIFRMFLGLNNSSEERTTTNSTATFATPPFLLRRL